MFEIIVLVLLLQQGLMKMRLVGVDALIEITLAPFPCLHFLPIFCFNSKFYELYDANVKLPKEVQQDFSQITFTTWRFLENGTIVEEDLQFENEEQLRTIFEAIPDLMVYFHDVQHDAKDQWIVTAAESWITTTKVFYGYKSVVMSVGYKQLFTNSEQALVNIEGIAHRCYTMLEWIFRILPGQFLSRQYIGHGMGCYVASRTEEKIKNSSQPINELNQFFALDPDDLSQLSKYLNGNPKPEITKSLATLVVVVYTSICLNSPPIKACDNTTTDTMGHFDVVFNGGAVQPGCEGNLTCSKDRAAELFASELHELHSSLLLVVAPCENFHKFTQQQCPCASENCMSKFVSPSFSDLPGRYYGWTNAQYPFGRGSNMNQP